MSAALRYSLPALALALTAMNTLADVTPTDLQVLGRALSFMESPLSGTVRMGIIYSATDPRTRRHAEDVRELFDGRLRIGNINLEPVMVDSNTAAEADVDLFFIPEQSRGDFKQIIAAAQARSIPCVTTDIARVREGLCALGIRSQPKIEILVHRSMAEKTGARFATAFRMMITEI